MSFLFSKLLKTRLTNLLLYPQGKGKIFTYWLRGRDGFDKPLPDLNLQAGMDEHAFKQLLQICYLSKKFYYLFLKKAFEGLGFVHLKILYGGNSPHRHPHLSGQLYLYGHLHETPFFLTPILTLSLHSYKQPGLVTDTRFLYPEGVDS